MRREQQRQQLHRLAEAHVIRQAGAEAEAREERQPRKPPLLVGTKLPRKSGRSGNLLQLAIAIRAEQLPQPPPSLDLGNRQVGPGAQAEALAEQLARRRLAPFGPALEERERRLDVLRAQHDPAPASHHQRQLQRRQLAQLAQRERRIADRDLPLVRAQASEAEQPAALLELLERLSLQLEAQPLAPPRGREHAEPGLLQRRRGVAQKGNRGLRSQVETRRSGLAQRRLELGPQPHRMTKAP